MSLSKTLYPLLRLLVQPRQIPPNMTEKLFAVSIDIMQLNWLENRCECAIFIYSEGQGLSLNTR